MNGTVIRRASNHLFAAAVLVIGPAILTTVLYVGLLAWAIAFGGGLGGPLALPGMVLMAVGFTGLSVPLLLAPSTVIAERVSPSCSVKARVWQIPLSSLVLIALLSVLLTIGAMSFSWGSTRTLQAGGILAAAELLLLGVYWWSLQTADLGFTLVVAGWRKLRRRTVG